MSKDYRDAERAYKASNAEYYAARERGDTRMQHYAHVTMVAAVALMLHAEIARRRSWWRRLLRRVL